MKKQQKKFIKYFIDQNIEIDIDELACLRNNAPLLHTPKTNYHDNDSYYNGSQTKNIEEIIEIIKKIINDEFNLIK